MPTPTPDYADPGNPPEKTSYIYPDWLPRDFFAHDVENYDVYTNTLHGTDVVVAIHKDLNIATHLAGEPVPPRDEFVQFVFDTFAYYWGVFEGYPYDRYIVKVLPPSSSQEPFTATAIGFVFVTNPNASSIQLFTTCRPPCAPNYKQFVTHEMFHAWNGETIMDVGAHINMIRPEVWVAEGATQYYGFRGMPNDLALHQRRFSSAWQYYSQRIGTQYDIPIVDMSEKWETTGDQQYYQMYYDKGACLFYLLDKEMIDRGMNLDDLMRYMYREYGLTGRHYTTTGILDALNTVTGHDWAEFFDRYVYGTEVLPLDGDSEYLEH